MIFFEGVPHLSATSYVCCSPREHPECIQSHQVCGEFTTKSFRAARCSRVCLHHTEYCDTDHSKVFKIIHVTFGHWIREAGRTFAQNASIGPGTCWDYSTSVALTRDMSNQFEGKLTYGTMCQTCHQRSERDTDFLELEINLEVWIPGCTAMTMGSWFYRATQSLKSASRLSCNRRS